MQYIPELDDGTTGSTTTASVATTASTAAYEDPSNQEDNCQDNEDVEKTSSWDGINVDKTQDPDDQHDDGNDDQKIPSDDFDSVAHVLFFRE
ncbi:unnamed protein product [Umbelopsis ramanniana]